MAPVEQKEGTRGSRGTVGQANGREVAEPMKRERLTIRLGRDDRRRLQGAAKTCGKTEERLASDAVRVFLDSLTALEDALLFGRTPRP